MSQESRPLVALAGRPNTGKTSLFNALTGSRQRVGNFEGTTVEKAEGFLRLPRRTLELVDLPGTSTICPDTGDERAAFDFLYESSRRRPLRVVCVSEASCLEDDLAFAAGLKSCGYPVAFVVNMADEAERNGLRLDAAALADALGAPVELCSARTGQGLDAVKAMLERDGRPVAADDPLDIRRAPAEFARRTQRRARQAAETAARAGLRILHDGTLPSVSSSAAIDRWLLHPVLGPLVLAAVLLALFEALFTWAAPLRDALSWALASAGRRARPMIPGSILPSLFCDGILPGLAAVAQFLPQVALLFAFLGVLEQSGYMPRAAAMVDRALRPFGLDGRVAIPFLSSHACAIPGILAARTIAGDKTRLKTVLLCPLMTCSARVPVYALLIAAFVPAGWRPCGLSGQALTMAGMYVFGAALALVLALLLQSTPLGERRPCPIAVLPPYRWPGPRDLGRSIWTRTSHFLFKGGRVIFLASVLLWALASFPDGPDRLATSWLGRAGSLVAPFFAPLGFDWRLSVAILASLAAREVFVGTLGTLFALSSRGGTDLAAALRAAAGPDGRPLYSLATAVSLLLFFAVSIQCVSTIAVVRRETGGWKWPALQFSAFFSLAYVLAWAGFHVTRALGG